MQKLLGEDFLPFLYDSMEILGMEVLYLYDDRDPRHERVNINIICSKVLKNKTNKCSNDI